MSSTKRMSLKKAMAITLVIHVSLLLTLAVDGQSVPVKEQIANEVKRLEQRLPALALPDNEAKSYQSALKRVAVMLRSDRVFLSLYYLQPVHSAVGTYDYHRSKAEVIKQGVDGFEAEWKNLGGQLAAREKAYVPESGETPAAAMALAEASLTQVHPYYQSGHLYGLNRSVDEGVYYFGRSSAFLDFALFCRQLQFKKPRTPLKLKSLEHELQAMEDETLAAYKQSEDKDLRQFITTNVSLKLAADLNHEQRYFGALLKYLDACMALKLLKATAPSPAQVELLKGQLAAFGKRLSSGDIDHSIGLMYWEMAQRALQPSADDEVGEPDLKRAVVILDEVLPRYFKTVSS